jgi:undecaprenyl-diphosphatase
LTIPESVFLGALQGITEFLPISSSAHLILAPWLLGIKDGGTNKLTYDVLLHFGTLIAIMSVYGKQFILFVVEGFVDMREGKFMGTVFSKIVLATLPAVIFGLTCKGLIETHLRTPYVAVFAPVAVSLLMLVAERMPTNRKQVSLSLAFAIGIAQALALIPGTSRSGITIAIAMLFGLKRNSAVDFSFLLSIPILLGTTLYETRHFHFDANEAALYLSGAFSALFFGFLSLRFLIGYLKKHSLDLFAYYRMGLAMVIFLLF